MNYRYKEYYDRFKELRKKIKNREATWADMEKLRLEYCGRTDIDENGITYYAGNTLRQGCLLYDEFMRKGVIQDVEENPEIIKNDINIPKNIELKSDGTYTSERIVSTDLTLKSKEDILKIHGYNPDEFELISCKHSIWQQGNKEKEAKNLYSSKISVRPRLLPLDINYYEKMFNRIINKKKSIENINDKDIEVIDNFKLLLLNYTDIHWGRYTSYKNDLQYNYNRILNTMNKAMYNFKDKKIRTVMVVLGSDFFNSDCYGTTSLRKNPQDNAMTFKDIFETGLDLCIDLICKAQQIAPYVRVIIIPGNHGNNEDFVLGKCLEAYFRDDIKINIEVCKNRGYTKWGKTLIGFTHGDKEKTNLGNLMAIEMPQQWAETDYHIWLTGHIHSIKETVVENNGVTVYSCPSLALDDEYTSNRGYKSIKRLMGMVIDREYGIENICYFNPDN